MGFKSKRKEDYLVNINKNLLLATAIIGIGLFVLPSTLSMFAGQHSWYNPNPATAGG